MIDTQVNIFEQNKESSRTVSKVYDKLNQKRIKILLEESKSQSPKNFRSITLPDEIVNRDFRSKQISKQPSSDNLHKDIVNQLEEAKCSAFTSKNPSNSSPERPHKNAFSQSNLQQKYLWQKRKTKLSGLYKKLSGGGNHASSH